MYGFTLPYILDKFLNEPAPPNIDTWNQNLKRWAIKADFNPFGISAKTTRKSIESWMLAAGVPLLKCIRDKAMIQRILFTIIMD